MRVMLRAKFPTKARNKAIENGSLPQIIGRFVEQFKPEASYFVADGGKRTGIFFVELVSVSDIPAMAEPFFAGLNAEIEIVPAMNLEDMQAGVHKAKSAM